MQDAGDAEPCLGVLSPLPAGPMGTAPGSASPPPTAPRRAPRWLQPPARVSHLRLAALRVPKPPSTIPGAFEFLQQQPTRNKSSDRWLATEPGLACEHWNNLSNYRRLHIHYANEPAPGKHKCRAYSGSKAAARFMAA